MMVGAHTVKVWAKAQPVLALSSGEAELYACVKAASESRGLKAMMVDLGSSPSVTVHVDASAAIGMVMKRGLSGVRHIDVQYLWVQDAIRCKELAVRKVDTKSNLADLFTKPLSSDEIEGHLTRAGFRW